MTDKLTKFSFESNDIRVVSINNDPWFVVVDICKALNLSNPTKAILNLDDDEKALTSIQGLSKGNEKANIVNESGLYTLILRCRDAVKKGTAPHRFRKWVTNEVLPSIRKTGSYTLTINLEQQQKIKQAVIDRYYRLGQTATYQSIYHDLYRKFNIPRYQKLPASKFDEAIKFLGGLKSEPITQLPDIDGHYHVIIHKGQPIIIQNMKNYKQQFTRDELCDLCWLWKASTTMFEVIETLYPLLKIAEHRLAGRAYSITHEHDRILNKARVLLDRETQNIDYEGLRNSDWLRVLPEIRQLDQTFLAY